MVSSHNYSKISRTNSLIAVAGRKTRERIYRKILLFSGITTISLLIGVFVTMISYGYPFLRDIDRFIEIVTENNWYPADEFNEGSYGALAMIYGTFLVGIPALLLSITWGLSIAIFLSEYIPNRITRMIQPVIEYIAAIPSVIFGLITYLYISEWVKVTFDKQSGRGPLAASIALAFMATPIIVSISVDALQSTPLPQRNAAKAFGATRYEVLATVAIPHAKYSMFSSVLLAFGRVLGETMVVLIVLGNSPVINRVPDALFLPAYTLTAAIANEIGDARFGSAEFSVIFVLALLLLMISFVVVYISNLITSGSPTFYRIMRLLYFPVQMITNFISAIIQQFVDPVEMRKELITRRIRIRRGKNVLFATVSGSIMLMNIIIVFSLLFKVIGRGFPGISIEFMTTMPSYSRLITGQYGIYSAIIGSLLLVLAASIIAFPIATLTGIYLSEFAGESRLNHYVQMAIVNINSIPSIVVGLFVYGFISVGLDWETGILPGGIALGIMMIPIITTNTIEALRNIPSSHNNSALALGSSNWEAVIYHRIPYSMASIVTGYVLAIARVFGELAPLILVAASFRFAPSPYPTGLIRESIRVLPYEVYYNLLYSTNKEYATMWAISIATVLLIFVALLNILAYYLRKKLRSRYEYNGSL